MSDINDLYSYRPLLSLGRSRMSKLTLMVTIDRKTLKRLNPKFRTTSLHIAKQLDLSIPVTIWFYMLSLTSDFFFFY